eukprot:4411750-Pyramimonas_sp.AAC.1
MPSPSSSLLYSHSARGHRHARTLLHPAIEVFLNRGPKRRARRVYFVHDLHPFVVKVKYVIVCLLALTADLHVHQVLAREDVVAVLTGTEEDGNGPPDGAARQHL